MCAHMRVSLRVGEKVQEWTFKSTQRSALGAPGSYALTRRDKDRFLGGMERNTQSVAYKRKMYNDPHCHSHDFWTALVTHSVLQWRWRMVRLAMHHKCNTIWECSSHTQWRTGNL